MPNKAIKSVLSKIEKYAQNQRTQYNLTSKSAKSAQEQVAPDYREVREIAANSAQLILSQYFLRNGQFYQPENSKVDGLKVLDFGCGVGRVMEAFRELGDIRTDGCDISAEMLRHAQASEELKGAELFLTNGYSTGDSPENFYDIAYSFLCFHHIPMRLTRLKILESLAANLKDDGMVFVEFKIYPGVTAGKIPHNHAHWTENMVAQYTNSASDVWITPDAVGLVMDDFRLFFDDVAILEFDLGQDLYNYNADAIYQYGFNELFVVASKNASMKRNMSKRG